jgi:iron complex transport system permease protein
MISHKVQKNTWIIFIFFFAAIFLGITKGSVNISLDKLFLGANQQILCLRLLRIFAAALAGSGLAVCGVILQAILRNPLAEPYLLGTSSGAGLGATIAIILGANNLGVPFLAFLGAIVSIVLVYNLARQQNKIPTQSLIMTGVMVSIAISAIMVFLLSYSSNEALHGVMWWLWGSLQICDLKLVISQLLSS